MWRIEMGYNAYGYLGAYIELPKVEKKSKQLIRRCSNKSCVNHKSEKISKEVDFCSKCGKEIEQEITKYQVENYYNFAEENGLDPEKFAQVRNDLDILIPNRGFGSQISWDENTEIKEEFVWGETKKYIAEFTKEAQEFINKFKEIYNIELKVKFGVVSYIM